jgi:acetylornithine/N-succinyldiaminopimelate aminotransferase
MSLASVSRMEAKLLLPTYERQPILFVRGRGVHLWDSEGKRYLDFPEWNRSQRARPQPPCDPGGDQAPGRRLIHVSNLFFHEYQASSRKC